MLVVWRRKCDAYQPSSTSKPAADHTLTTAVMVCLGRSVLSGASRSYLSTDNSTKGGGLRPVSSYGSLEAVRDDQVATSLCVATPNSSLSS